MPSQEGTRTTSRTMTAMATAPRDRRSRRTETRASCIGFKQRTRSFSGLSSSCVAESFCLLPLKLLTNSGHSHSYPHINPQCGARSRGWSASIRSLDLDREPGGLVCEGAAMSLAGRSWSERHAALSAPSAANGEHVLWLAHGPQLRCYVSRQQDSGLKLSTQSLGAGTERRDPDMRVTL